MKSRLFFAAVLVATVIVVVTVPGAAVAQENETTNRTPTDPEYLERVDSDVVLLDWTFEDGVFSVRLENRGHRPTTVTVSEAMQLEEGTGQMSIQQETLMPGETTITMPVPERDGAAALTLTTPESLRNGTGTYISTGGGDDNPFAALGGTSGLITGIGVTVAVALGAASFVVWRESDGVEVAD